MGETLLITRADGSTKRYTLQEEHNDGAITALPDTSAEAIRERAGSEPVTLEEIAQITGQPIPSDNTP